MHPLFKKLLFSRHIEYLAVDESFNILELSHKIAQFADRPQDLSIGKDVRLSFPELVGIEEILSHILQGRQLNFELKGIGRFSGRGNLLYFDMYIINDSEDYQAGKKLIILCEDVTERMNLEQTLVQRSNETTLLLDAWAASSQYLDKIIQYIGDALFVTNSSSIIKIVNKAANSLFSYNNSELIGKPLSLIIDESQVEKLISPKNGSCANGINTTKMVCQTKTGDKILVAFSCSIIESELEEEQDIIYIGRDINR
ncbi:MAG: PAS domain-containing protein [Coleofasciculus chthonoplastes F3-SA18-01]|jgi:PAS domain S-box-containing protein|uniref:PAS domain-containing protein n=1 Tax=Coleofasciculus chthonoplastes TaxID=64178 RepID=UPI0032FD66BB